MWLPLISGQREPRETDWNDDWVVCFAWVGNLPQVGLAIDHLAIRTPDLPPNQEPPPHFETGVLLTGGR